MPRYIVTKIDHPEAFGMDYVNELQYIPTYDKTKKVKSELDSVIETGVMSEDQAKMVAARPHVKAVEEDVEDVALGDVVTNAGLDLFTKVMMAFSDGYDPEARNFHQLGAAYAAGHNGAGVVVAVGDTGIRNETANSTFAGRIRASKSFIAGESIEDGNGHGDFCCTCATPPASELIVGKVLSNAGSGPRSGIIAFIAWAVEQGANVISLSLGGGGFSQAYEDVIKSARDRGVLVFCASGNGGRNNEPVNAPANSPSAIPNGATDQRTSKVADFSCKGPEMAKGFSGAGVNVPYDPPGSTPKKTYSGTSMGTPIDVCCYAVVLGASDKDVNAALEALIKGAKDTSEPATAEGNGIPQAMNSILLLKPPEPAPDPVKPPPDGKTKNWKKFGYLDLGGVFRPGSENKGAVWGEIDAKGNVRVLPWHNSGADAEG